MCVCVCVMHMRVEFCTCVPPTRGPHIQGVGDIEDVNGKPCIVCPWHYYQVDLATGDKYYQSIKFEDGKMKKGDWCRCEAIDASGALAQVRGLMVQACQNWRRGVERAAGSFLRWAAVWWLAQLVVCESRFKCAVI